MFGRALRRGLRRMHGRSHLTFLERILEPSNRFTQSLPEFGELLRPEDEEDYRKNHQEVHRLKKAFTHSVPSLSDHLNRALRLNLPNLTSPPSRGGRGSRSQFVGKGGCGVAGGGGGMEPGGAGLSSAPATKLGSDVLLSITAA